MDHLIEYDESCRPCKATGLYVGMAEKSGAAVVCHTCDGTGKHHVKIEWNDFNGRQRQDGVSRVYKTNPGICIGAGNGHRLEDFGGISYEDWKSGKEFVSGTENRKFTCPAWWYQSADYSKKPEWKECGYGAFPACPSFSKKDQCWQRWDKEERERR